MRRRLEITVPGSPEEVWDAIATSEGQSAWAFGTEIDEHSVRIHRSPFGPDVAGPVTASERPSRFAYEEPVPGDAPVLAVEFLVEARSQGSCVVRVVTGFADAGEEWEDLLDGITEGWRMALVILRAYLTYFPGRKSERVEATYDTGLPADARDAVSARLFSALGTPPLTGTVEYTSPGYVLLRTDDALYAISAFPMATPGISLNVVGHHYNGSVPTTDWQQWLADLHL